MRRLILVIFSIFALLAAAVPAHAIGGSGMKVLIDLLEGMATHNAVYFAGATNLGVVAQPYNMPSSSNYFFASFWYNSTVLKAPTSTIINGQQCLCGFSVPTGVVVTFTTRLDSDTSANLAVSITRDDTVESSGVDHNVSYGTTSAPFPLDGNWHHVAITIDNSGPSGSYALDGTVVSFPSIAQTVNGSGTISYSLIGGNFFIGGNGPPNGSNIDMYKGDLAEVLMYTNGSIALNSAVLADLRDSTTGKAIGLGLNCSRPLSATPNMCNRGGLISFPFFGANYTLIPVSGALPVLVANSDPCLYPNSSGRGCQVSSGSFP